MSDSLCSFNCVEDDEDVDATLLWAAGEGLCLIPGGKVSFQGKTLLWFCDRQSYARWLDQCGAAKQEPVLVSRPVDVVQTSGQSGAGVSSTQ